MASKPLVSVGRASEFYDALADLVVSMPLEDIRSEMRDEGLNPDREIEKTRKRLFATIGHSESSDVTATMVAVLQKTARTVSDIVAGSLPRIEKKHMLEATFAKASAESDIDMDKVVASLKGLIDEDKRLIEESISNLLKKQSGSSGPQGPG